MSFTAKSILKLGTLGTMNESTTLSIKVVKTYFKFQPWPNTTRPGANDLMPTPVEHFIVPTQRLGL
jgi:hypothetical protein